MREGHVDDLHVVAARLVIADRRFHQRFDLGQLLRRARRVAVLAGSVGLRRSVHGHRDREPLHGAGIDNAGLRCFRYFVVRRFLGAATARFGVVAAALLRVGKRIGDRHGAAVLGVGVAGVLLDRLGGANDFGVGIEGLAGRAGVIVVHVGRDLDADMARANDAGDDGFDALAQLVFHIRGVLLLVGSRGVSTGLVISTGQQRAFVVNNGDAVGHEARNWRPPRDAGWP